MEGAGSLDAGQEPHRVRSDESLDEADVTGGAITRVPAVGRRTILRVAG